MSSQVSLSIRDQRFFAPRIPITKCARLLVALLAISANLAPAQTGSSQRVDSQSPTQTLVSINQLRTPGKARKATENARKDFVEGRFDTALHEAKRALAIYPRSAMALNIQGAVNLSRANYADAGRDFQQAIDADPALGQAYLGLGMVYTSQGRFKEALAPLDRAAASLPGSWLVHFESALAHLGIEEPEAAITEITHAERFTGSAPRQRAEASYLRALARCQMKDYSGAKRDLKEAVALDPTGLYAALAAKKLQLISIDDGQQIANSTHTLF
jgi:tetratricopeptide (TPR) repeat protein